MQLIKIAEQVGLFEVYWVIGRVHETQFSEAH